MTEVGMDRSFKIPAPRQDGALQLDQVRLAVVERWGAGALKGLSLRDQQRPESGFFRDLVGVARGAGLFVSLCRARHGRRIALPAHAGERKAVKPRELS